MGVTNSLVGACSAGRCVRRAGRGPMCPGPTSGEGIVKRRKEEEKTASIQGRDSCSPEICVDILVAGREGYLVVSPVCS